MKTPSILVIFLLGGLSQSMALTLEDIAGTYEGWRTETTPTGTTRYLQFDEILPDGTFHTTLVSEERGVIIAQTSVITIDESGSIAGPWAEILRINGHQLHIKARSDGFAVHAVTHRTE